MKSTIRFSIVTVTYNAEKYLRQTLDSMLRQKYRNYEYIVVDGGSKDRTLSILEEYVPLFEGRMRYISEPDDGLYDAMNKGIRMAQGDYIGLINSDDYYEMDALENVAKVVVESQYPDVVYSDLYVIDADSKYLYTIPGDATKLKKGMLVNHPTCFVRKTAYEKYGLFDLQYRIVADYDLMLRIYNNGGKFAKTDEPLASFRVGGLSNGNYKSTLEKYKVQRKYYGFFHCRYIWLRGVIRCKLLQKKTKLQ